MKRASLPVLCVALLSSAIVATAQTYTWTGIDNGWKNQAAPTGAGGEILIFDKSLGRPVVVPGGSYDSFLFEGDEDFDFTPSSSFTLALANGISFSSSPDDFSRASFNSNITFGLTQAQTWDAGFGELVVSGKITGPGPLTLQSSFSYYPSFYFNNPGAVNDYTGGTMIGSASGTPTVAFWNSSPFGTGSVSFYNGGSLIAHGTQTVANAIIFNSGDIGQTFSLETWGGPLIFTGAITLANDTAFISRTKPHHFPNEDNTEEVSSPGPRTREPIIFTGNIGDNGLGRSLTITGTGLFILQPASGNNTFSGGTTVTGNLIFGNNQAIPSTGTIMMVTSRSYVGLGDVSPTNFATQFGDARFDKSRGSIGVDTLPGNPIVTLSDSINLSSTGGNGTTPLGFGPDTYIGTATKAILTGSITPQGISYQFGGGGGTLYVQSSLSNVAGNGVEITGTGRGLKLSPNSSDTQLKLYLQGANTYTWGTRSSGILIFDGASAIPATGSLVAEGSSTNVGNSYIGYTDIAGINTSVIGADAATFLAKFDATNTWGIIGFDTHDGNATANITGAIDLTGFNDGVYLGTATSAILSGSITPSTVTNSNNTANTLRFTATNGGTLTVASTLADNGSPLSLRLGADLLSDGTIVVNGANTYTGGTTVGGIGLILVAGNNAAFGTGTVVVGEGGFALQAGSAGLNLANPVSFSGPMTNGFYLTGPNAFTLSGNITGSETNSILLVGSDSPTVTLSGNNSGYAGMISLYHNSTLNLAHNNAAGQGAVNFESANSIVAFTGAATAPILHGLSGDAGHLILPNGTNLIIDTGHMNRDYDFGGVISGPSGAVTDASLTVTTTNPDTEFLYLYGHNNYSGGTNITGYAALALGAADSAGTGTITINATGGGVALNTGVTLTNPIVFNQGALAGFGTFAPSSVSGTGQTAGKLTFGANQMVFPGIPGENGIPGKLTLATNVAFADGGEFALLVEDPATPEGFGSLNITGSLDLASISTNFLFTLESIGSDEYSYYSSGIVWGNSYSLLVITAGGGISGFNPANFSFDVSKFQDGLIPSSYFTVTADANNLYLNFTAIPEPSTWALLALGAGSLGLTAWRRRRA